LQMVADFLPSGRSRSQLLIDRLRSHLCRRLGRFLYVIRHCNLQLFWYSGTFSAGYQCCSGLVITYAWRRRKRSPSVAKV